MPLMDVTHANFDEVIEKYPLIVLDFWAVWCGPCKSFAPVFEAAAERHPDVLFGRINSDEEADLARQFEVRSIPTLIGAKDGEITNVRLGAQSPAQFESMIAELRK